MTLVADELARLRDEATSRLAAASSLAELEALDTEYLGRSRGRITELMSGLRSLPQEERPAFGQRLNALKAELLEMLERRRAELSAAALAQRLRAEAIDVTLPG